MDSVGGPGGLKAEKPSKMGECDKKIPPDLLRAFGIGRIIGGMDATTTAWIVLIGLFEAMALFYLWKTNRRLNALFEEMREGFDKADREIEELRAEVDERLEELQEKLRAANSRLDESILTSSIIEDIDAQITCLRTPGGVPRRRRRSDHRQ